MYQRMPEQLEGAAPASSTDAAPTVTPASTCGTGAGQVDAAVGAGVSGTCCQAGYLASRCRKPKPSERVRVAVKVSNSTGVGYGFVAVAAGVW